MSFVRRLFSRIGRLLWSRGCLIFLVGAVIFVVIACVLIDLEENWRGARDWAATKAKWEAKGVSFDRHDYVPPVVPDEKNLAAIPLFEITEIKDPDGRSGGQKMLALEKAMRSDLPGHDLPAIRSGTQGTPPNLEEAHKKIAEQYAAAFKDSAAPGSPLGQFEALYPFIADLRSAAATRPSFRIDQDYLMEFPAERPLGPVTITIKLSKILTIHAILALEEHQPDVALADIRVNFILARGVLHDPTLVGGLVGIGILAINNGAIWYGMAIHGWNDDQLAQIQAELAQFDFLRRYQFAMRAEAVMFAVPTLDSVVKNRKLLKDMSDDESFINLYSLMPKGWLDQNKLQIVDAALTANELVNPEAHRATLDRAKLLFRKYEEGRSHWSSAAPWNLLFNVMYGPVWGGVTKFSQAQVFWIDEARIACALERYRLAQGKYPDSLQALVPACISELPHDLINGESYHYQLQADGTYLLYSVGWNETDDGGKMVHTKGEGSGLDYEQGDWVWPTPKL